MSISQRTYYGLRALFELAKAEGRPPLKIGDIAQSQAIPPRFLEAIMNQLKQGGFATSRRGAEGGYVLARPARDITAGDVLRFFEGPLRPASCPPERGEGLCQDPARCPFRSLWSRAEAALSGVYDTTTLLDLVEDERLLAERPADYSI